MQLAKFCLLLYLILIIVNFLYVSDELNSHVISIGQSNILTSKDINCETLNRINIQNMYIDNTSYSALLK